MAYTCSAQVAEDCVGEGLFNAAYETDDGPVCVMCAIELGLSD